MKKLAAIDNVQVRLNDGMTILDLKPGNAITVSELRRIIKNNGFVSKEVTAVAHGSTVAPDTFVVSGTNERLALASAPQAAGDSWRIVVAPPR